jgi:hypothetical protein
MKTHVYIVSPVEVDGKVFPAYGIFRLKEKVIMTRDCKKGECHVMYKIEFNEKEYLISDEHAVAITMKEAATVKDPYLYRRERDQDDTKDYFKAVEELMGIDMKLNYAPQHEARRPGDILAKEDDQERLSSGPETRL